MSRWPIDDRRIGGRCRIDGKRSHDAATRLAGVHVRLECGSLCHTERAVDEGLHDGCVGTGHVDHRRDAPAEFRTLARICYVAREPSHTGGRICRDTISVFRAIT
jgi:hypothetical protein